MKFVKIVNVKPGDLLPFPGNAKLHDEGALDESVARFGQFRSVVARQLPDGTYQLLAGHGTTDALARAELAKVRVELVECDDDEALAMVVAENAIGRRAGFNESALADLLGQLDAAGGFTGTGVTSAEYDDLMAKLAETASTTLPVGDEASTTWETATGQDLRDRYETKGTRTVSFDYPYPTFIWLAESLSVLRERLELESNSELFVHLVAEQVGSTPPDSLDETPDDDELTEVPLRPVTQAEEDADTAAWDPEPSGLDDATEPQRLTAQELASFPTAGQARFA